jgi:hypothetical protein
LKPVPAKPVITVQYPPEWTLRDRSILSSKLRLALERVLIERGELRLGR